jgi:hypothetical protein
MKLTYLETVQNGNVFDFYLGVEFSKDDDADKNDPFDIENPSILVRSDGTRVISVDILDAGLASDEWVLTPQERTDVIDFIFDNQIAW